LSETCIYVAAGSSSTASKNLVAAFASTANGNVPPIQYIKGTKTKLDFNYQGGIAVGSDYKIYVSNADNDTITVYAAGATGNAKPIQTISGSNTGLSNNKHIALDSDGNIYVANYSGGSTGNILVFAAGANGNVSPIQTIGGSNSDIDEPFGIAVDAEDNIYVAQLYGHGILVFPAGSNGNVAPTQNITGTGTYDYGIAVDSTQEIYSAEGNWIHVYAAGATGNATPIRQVAGTKTKLNNLSSIALNGSNMYVTNDTKTVLVFAANANGNAKPLQIIQGTSTMLKDNDLRPGLAVR